MMFIIITLTYLYNHLVLMELGLHSCLAPLDHPDALLCRQYLRPYLSSARAVILYTRAKFRPLLSNNNDDDTTSLYYSTVIIARELFVSTFVIVLISLIWWSVAARLRASQPDSVMHTGEGLHIHLRYNYSRYVPHSFRILVFAAVRRKMVTELSSFSLF